MLAGVAGVGIAEALMPKAMAEVSKVVKSMMLNVEVFDGEDFAMDVIKLMK